MIKLSEIESKYGEYLVDENKLKELLVKPEPKTVWDLKDGDKFYLISHYGKVERITWNDDEFDLRRREYGNAFLTREEAEFELERRKCEAIMLKYGRRMLKYKDDNYTIRFNNDDKQAFVEVWRLNQFQGTIYFDTQELAQKAIDEIGEERLKKYVFRVSEDDVKVFNF